MPKFGGKREGKIVSQWEMKKLLFLSMRGLCCLSLESLKCISQVAKPL
jgi:hypothetical protein